MPVIMGTAGHIDHGKTSLVRALTNIDCDRLEEEKRRGITIELGFAFLNLPNNVRLSIVDVPGHEKFVKNMVSGASGIDFVMLVIAADEGVMPQTKEHLEICSLLGVKTGLVVLTKVDMVAKEWLELAIEDITSFTKGTFLENAPILSVSSQTGEGIAELKAELAKIEEQLRPKKRSDLFRLPIDRIFTIKGHGTIVTGTMIAGQISLGEDLSVYPKDYPACKTTKVRALQSHDETVSTAPAGRRTAVNLAGLDVADINKGEVLGRPHSLFASLSWDVKLSCLSSALIGIKNRTEIHFHHGTKETLARIYLLDRDKLNPGDSALCQVRFKEPMVGVFGDRCIIRAYSPLRTIAGGSVINPMSLNLRRKDPLFVNKFEALSSMDKLASQELILAQLSLLEEQGANFAELCVLTNLDSKQLEKELSLLGSKQELFCFDKEDKRYLNNEVLKSLEASALAFIAEFHNKHPEKTGLGKAEFNSSWGKNKSPKLLHFIIERLIKKHLIEAEGEFLKIPTHKASLGSNQQDTKLLLLKIYEEAGDTPPNLKDVLESLALSTKEAMPILKMLQSSNELIKVAEGLYYSGAVLDKICQKVRVWFKDHDDLNLAGLKEITGLSRKFLIALMEYFDREKLTMRVGDKRILRGGDKS